MQRPDLNIEHLKTKLLEKDWSSFRTSCKTTAKQALNRLKIEIIGLKDAMKMQEKSKQYLLKAKYIRFQETLRLYQNTMKMSTKLTSTIATIQKTHNLQVITIFMLNGDIMAKICECGSWW
jgi:hypothetical protein